MFEKECIKCKRLFDIEDFFVKKMNGKPYRMASCKKCDRAYQKKTRDLRLFMKKRRCKEVGITLDDFYRILVEQNGRCKLCGKEETIMTNKAYNRKSDLAIDHCHTTGRFRGLLCFRCNVTVGTIEKVISEEKMEAILQYIKV